LPLKRLKEESPEKQGIAFERLKEKPPEKQGIF